MKLYHEDEIFHPSYECSYDGCWCHSPEQLRDYLDDLNFAEYENESQYDRERFGGWGDDLS